MFDKKAAELKRPQSMKELVDVLESLVGNVRIFHLRRGHEILSLISYTHRKYLAEYFKKLPVNSFDSPQLENYLPQIIANAFRDLCSGSDELSVSAREYFQKDEVLDPTKLTEYHRPERWNVVHEITGFFRDIFDDEKLAQTIRTELDAESIALGLKFEDFLHRVYARGMRPLLDGAREHYTAGNFAGTILESTNFRDNRSLLFIRPKENLAVSFGLDRDHDEGDYFSHSFKATNTDLKTCLGMIDDVLVNWPEDEVLRRKIFRGVKKSSFTPPADLF